MIKNVSNGTVTPIPKKGDRTLLSNIRPITITHICGKILEKLVSLRIEEHCESNQLFSEAQMGGSVRDGRPQWQFLIWSVILMMLLTIIILVYVPLLTTRKPLIA